MRRAQGEFDEERLVPVRGDERFRAVVEILLQAVEIDR